MEIRMDINVQKLSNISSTGTEQTDNTYNTSEKNINITNTPASGLNNKKSYARRCPFRHY